MAICRIDGCTNEAGVPGSARGLCRAHYRRWQRYGDEHEPLRRVANWGDEKCSTVGCGKRVYAHGMCEAHNAVAKRCNDPEKQKLRNRAFAARLRAKQEVLMGRPRPDTCELCGQPPNGRGSKAASAHICFDHDHETGKPRGWLCDRCNKVLGMVKDDPVLLRTLAAYLESHDGETERRAA